MIPVLRKQSGLFPCLVKQPLGYGVEAALYYQYGEEPQPSYKLVLVANAHHSYAEHGLKAGKSRRKVGEIKDKPADDYKEQGIKMGEKEGI